MSWLSHRTMASLIVACSLIFLEGCQCPSCTGLQRDVEELMLEYPCDESLVTPPILSPWITDRPEEQNEAHDCQRLVTDGEFGPLVAVYPLADAMDDRAVFTDSSGIAVATVFSWEPGGGYPRLGINAHWQCLWLRNWHGAWQAEMRKRESRGARCQDGPGPTVQELRVRRLFDPDPPPTARWGWDDEAELHYIGIKCGDDWCMIGAEGFQPEPALTDAPAEEQRYATLGPGWYDSQHLAIDDGDGNLRPGPWATIYPARSLRDRTRLSHFRAKQDTTWFTVGYIRLDGGNREWVSHYEEKLGLQPPGDSPEDGWNVVRLVVTGPNDGPHWRAQVESVGGDRRDFPVRFARVTHSSHGAARWRWLESDESGWFSCAEGCCTPETNGFEDGS